VQGPHRDPQFVEEKGPDDLLALVPRDQRSTLCRFRPRGATSPRVHRAAAAAGEFRQRVAGRPAGGAIGFRRGLQTGCDQGDVLFTRAGVQALAAIAVAVRAWLREVQR
jgi:hypothetical protein